MLFKDALGEVLREERQAQGLTLRDVSSQATIALGYLCQIEQGKREVSSQFLEAIASKGLGVPAHELVIRTAIRMAGFEIPDTTESLFTRNSEWHEQYSDLVGA